MASAKESSKRWPGSDEGVTVNDFRFLQKWQPEWWSKALGIFKAPSILTCVVCHRAKTQSEYPESIWRHQMDGREHHRCRECFNCPKCPAGEVHSMYDFNLGKKIANAAKAETGNLI